MLNRSTRLTRNCKLRLLFTIALAFASATLGRANLFVTIFDPQFYRVPVSEAIQGTSQTVLAYYRVDGENLVAAQAEEIGTENRTAIKEQTLAHAQYLLKNLTPHPIRDSQGTITALILESPDPTLPPDPTLSSVLLLPELNKRYEDVLGPDCLAAVPNRRTLFLFPRPASNVQLFATAILSLYHNDPWPVSTEIFAPANGTPRVIDRFNNDF